MIASYASGDEATIDGAEENEYDSERETERDTHRHIHPNTQRETYTHTNRERHAQRDRQTHLDQLVKFRPKPKRPSEDQKPINRKPKVESTAGQKPNNRSRGGDPYVMCTNFCTRTLKKMYTDAEKKCTRNFQNP